MSLIWGCGSPSAGVPDGSPLGRPADGSRSKVDAGRATGFDAGEAKGDAAVDNAPVADASMPNTWVPGPHPDQPAFEVELVDNAEGDFASRGWLEPDSAFRQNAEYAAEIWSRFFVSPHRVSIRVFASRSVIAASAAFDAGPRTGPDDGLWSFGPAALTKLQTGENPGTVRPDGADMIVDINATYENFWIDPSPEDGIAPAVPSGKLDLVSTFFHEIGHGLGIASERSVSQSNYGERPLADTVFSFDSFLVFQDGGPAIVDGQPNRALFEGPEARRVYGARVPLASYAFGSTGGGRILGRNLGHLGDFSQDPTSPNYYDVVCEGDDPLALSVVSSCPGGRRRWIQPIDVAILKDLGYPTIL